MAKTAADTNRNKWAMRLAVAALACSSIGPLLLGLSRCLSPLTAFLPERAIVTVILYSNPVGFGLGGLLAGLSLALGSRGADKKSRGWNYAVAALILSIGGLIATGVIYHSVQVRLRAARNTALTNPSQAVQPKTDIYHIIDP